MRAEVPRSLGREGRNCGCQQMVQMNDGSGVVIGNLGAGMGMGLAARIWSGDSDMVGLRTGRRRGRRRRGGRIELVGACWEAWSC